MAFDFEKTRKWLGQFDFQRLFVEELGWSQPPGRKPAPFLVKENEFSRQAVAELGGVVVFEIQSPDGKIPDAKTRAAVHREIAKSHHENLLIFVDRDRTQSLWYWAKRLNGKVYPRDHLYCRGQPGDLFLSKLGQIVFDLSDFDAEGKVSIVEVANRLRAALDIERVTKRFYRDFQEQHDALLELIEGVTDERYRRWYTSVLLNRLMFIYFLQKKHFLDNGDLNYLRHKLEQSREQGRDRFFSDFLKVLFFEGFAKPPEKRSGAARAILGQIRYLNGGLFLPHKMELECPKLDVPDKAFENLFDLFDRYSWNLNDTPGGQDDEINPDVLGYIFEKYINQKSFGAYYTRPEITEYLCEHGIHRLILEAINTPESIPDRAIPGLPARHYASLGDLLLDLDAPLCRRLLQEVLPRLSILDPACGSGAFLVAAMKTLINVYSAAIGKIKFLADRNLSRWLNDAERAHPNVGYFIKKSIITDNLFGVDIMEEAMEIAKLRLFLALVASAQTVEQLEPLPNIDFNIVAGNSLIGLVRVDDKKFEEKLTPALLFRKSFQQILEEKNRLIDNYRHTAEYAEDLTALRDNIEKKKKEAYETLNEILVEEFDELDIKYERATWDTAKNREGKPVKRALKIADIEALHPFHWGYEFDQILHKRGGFDAILTNPPWEVFKPNGKEFFEEHSDLVSKKKMTIHDFEKEQGQLLEDEDIRSAWLSYLSQFPHQSTWFRSAPQYKNQISIVNGKKAGTDINSYKLFLEQCFNLLRQGGRCGIIMPGGVYTDLGSKQLRELLFEQAEIGVLFGLSNERFIFEAVHHAQKFCLLVFQKGARTREFEAGFRINPREAVSADRIDAFLHNPAEHICLAADLIRRLSPDSLSVMEFRSDADVRIVEKMLKFPLLGDDLPDGWNIRFYREFDMTNDSHLFKTTPGAGRVPLYEGKMIWQFGCRLAEPRYWVSEKDGRKALSGTTSDSRDLLDYEEYRFGFRDVAATTNERSAIGTILPRGVFAGNTVPVHLPHKEKAPSLSELVFFTGVFDSFVFDWMIRKKITNHLNFFFVYQMPVPRLREKHSDVGRVVDRAGRLICTTPEFDDLAKELGLKSHRFGATALAERGKLRAELDGLIAHLYGLTEEEFAHVLSTFPLVPDPEKLAAQNAFRDVERGLIR